MLLPASMPVRSSRRRSRPFHDSRKTTCAALFEQSGRGRTVPVCSQKGVVCVKMTLQCRQMSMCLYNGQVFAFNAIKTRSCPCGTNQAREAFGEKIMAVEGVFSSAQFEYVCLTRDLSSASLDALRQPAVQEKRPPVRSRLADIVAVEIAEDWSFSIMMAWRRRRRDGRRETRSRRWQAWPSDTMRQQPPRISRAYARKSIPLRRS